MTKYTLIIEGSWCGRTHIHGIFDNFYDVMIAVWDFIQDNSTDEEQTRLLTEFANNDFSFIDGILVIDEIVVD